MKVSELLHRGEQELAGVDTARLDAEVLLASSLGTSRERLYTYPDEPVSAESEECFTALLKKRRQDFPLAYLLGSREFWSLDLKVDRHTLIPRPETELLVEQALNVLPVEAVCRVLDLGTGSGAIALAIASERPLAQVLAVDISGEALSIARQNAQQLKLQNIEFLQSDWFADVSEQQFDLIVSNPPYVESSDAGFEQAEIRYEPRLALDGGMEGMDAYRVIVPLAKDFMSSTALLLLEHGWQQGPALRALLQSHGYQQLMTYRDYSGMERCTAASKP